ncbi:MAG: ral secretion pathway protein [Blastocatellia bacterium]|jgi:general secretion pathway protein D|nr:ral secretion pathway protein [Blastocatellia bacterium]
MKFSAQLRSACGLLLVFCLLATPLAAMGSKGKKNYERGLSYEAAQQWEKAAEEFILAVAAEPSNIQYQLHYRRAVFNASQEAMRKGDALALQKDYLGAYNSFRQAYGYDATNELAVTEAERMLRLKRDNDGGDADAEPETGNSEAKMTPTSTQVGLDSSLQRGRPQQQQSSQPTRAEQLRVVSYKGDLKNFIRSLADELHIDVLFDSQSFQKQRTIEVKLHDVTTPKVLDFVFMQEGLFFQKLDRNTIFVADQSKRPLYQELVIQTFYLANIDPEEARTMIQAAIPAQQGRPAANVIPHKSTNSITVRDTPENIRLISSLLENVDKDLAEVVMEVNIYEMQHNDLLQLGNQVGSAGTLGNLFNTGALVAPVGAAKIAQAAVSALPTAFGAAFLIPSSSFSAFQQKDRSRLLASTQIHAFDREASRARIGQRVPIQTAQITSLGFSNSSNTAPAGGTSGVFGGTGYPVINYEPVGLTLDFTPQVFPNLDVQVKMNIESKDVQGLGSLTPTFTERSISGTARIKNNQTMMIASVAQTNQARGRQGLPLLGLVPVLGRLFSTPTHNNYQTDIVITVTPHVLRAPSVTPRDRRGFPSGSQQMPIAGSLEAMLRESDRLDQSPVAARSVENQPAIQSPSTAAAAVNSLSDAQSSPDYIPAPKALLPAVDGNTAAAVPLHSSTSGAAETVSISNVTTTAPETLPTAQALFKDNAPSLSLLRPSAIPASVVKSLAAPPSSLDAAQVNGTAPEPAVASVISNPSKPDGVRQEVAEPSKEDAGSSLASGNGELKFEREIQELRVGEKRRITLLLTADSPLSLVILPLRFDPRAVSVHVVSAGYALANTQAAPTITQTPSPGGKLLISLGLPPEAMTSSHPSLVVQLELEALEAGESMISIEPGATHLIAPEGHDLRLSVMQTRVLISH